MKPDGLRLLSIAVAYGRVGYVFFVGDELKDWQLSKSASDSPANARAKTKEWIDFLNPNVVVTENVGMKSRKSPKTIRRIHAVAGVAKSADLMDTTVIRKQSFKNKYLEADALCERYPQIKNWNPETRKAWLPEPRNISYFEALSMVTCPPEVPSH